jgi:hypothetical protein
LIEPIRLPPERKTGVPSTRSLAIRLAGWLSVFAGFVWVAGMVMSLLTPHRKRGIRAVVPFQAGGAA